MEEHCENHKGTEVTMVRACKVDKLRWKNEKGDDVVKSMGGPSKNDVQKLKVRNWK